MFDVFLFFYVGVNSGKFVRISHDNPLLGYYILFLSCVALFPTPFSSNSFT